MNTTAITALSILASACAVAHDPSTAEALDELEAATGARWRAVFDERLGTATIVDRIPGGGAFEPATGADSALLSVIPDLAVDFVHEWPSLFGPVRAQDLALRELAADPAGGAAARFEVLVGGLPLEGGEVRVAVGADGTIRAVTGSFPPEARLAHEPALTGDQARLLALVRVTASCGPPLELERPPALIAVVHGREVRPAWRVTIVRAEEAQGRPAVRRTVLLDAATGELLREREGLLAGRALGSGVGVDGVRHPLDVWLDDGRYALRDETRTPAGIRTYTADGHGRLPGRLVRSDAADRWDEVDPGAGAAVDAHAAAALVYDYLARVHGHDSLDGRGGPIRLVVHYGSGVANAFWDGRRAVFGDGDGETGPLPAALDVVAHELFHGVTQAGPDLLYEGEPGALCESLSDVFATFLELDAAGSPGAGPADWTFGEDVAAVPFRDLAEPWRTGQPAHMSHYFELPLDPDHDMGGVHINCSIPSMAAYLAAEGGTHRVSGRRVVGAGPAAVRAIWFRAAMRYSGPRTRFVDFAEATRVAAEDLAGPGSAEAIAVEDAWRAVGVLP